MAYAYKFTDVVISSYRTGGAESYGGPNADDGPDSFTFTYPLGSDKGSVRDADLSHETIGEQRAFASIADGTSNTVMFAEQEPEFGAADWSLDHWL